MIRLGKLDLCTFTVKVCERYIGFVVLGDTTWILETQTSLTTGSKQILIWCGHFHWAWQSPYCLSILQRVRAPSIRSEGFWVLPLYVLELAPHYNRESWTSGWHQEICFTGPSKVCMISRKEGRCAYQDVERFNSAIRGLRLVLRISLGLNLLVI